ncbi:MAG: A/G-specific adenine glycosylase [bacterium]
MVDTRKKLSPKEVSLFQRDVWAYYAKNRRYFSWREAKHYDDPYKIVVSEVMLQQTQASRVVGKYEEFLRAFPDFTSLNRATVAQVLATWRGLGYNRRAIALKKIAEIVVEKYGRTLPQVSIQELDALPHIGPATACSISAFAWNTPVSFIETNIRRVIIHRFFKDKEKVSDREILALVEETLPTERSRDWYYALMDYGSMLKTTIENPNRKSVHYKRQSAFVGSNRQVRGAILAVLGGPSAAPCTQTVLLRNVQKYIGIKTISQKDINQNIKVLAKEGFLAISGKHVSIM